MKKMLEKFIKKRYISCLYISVCLFLFFSCNTSYAEAKKKIVLQLKWKHQFQFAGYYAAIEKGYYKDAGLDVILKERTPNVYVENELLSGRADFGVGMPDILIAHQHGKPFVVLAAILQHSPLALFAHQNSNIISPQDLEGKKVMLGDGDLEIRAMLLNEGILENKINILPRAGDVNNLISGKVDAVSGYLTDMPLILREHKIHYSIIRPRTYGIDFYGDCLFTTEKKIKEDPEQVKEFLLASMKGWEYAMEHPKEITDLILKKYSTRLSRDMLLYEAKTMRELMLPDLVEIGHMNPNRWKHIADTLVKLKMMPANYSLDGFIYNPNPDLNAEIKKVRQYEFIILLIIGGIGGLLFFLNRKLKKAVNKQTKQLNDEKLFSDVLIESLPGNFFVYENGERLIRWNSTFRKESGYTDEELLGMHPLEWFADDEKKKVSDAMQTLFEKGKSTIEASMTFKKLGKVVPYYHSAVVLEMNDKKYIVGIGLDLTEKKELATQLLQAQKMESIGRFAGGIAHDFNNILTTILGYSQLMLLQMKEDNLTRQQVSQIFEAGKKASALIKQLLAFSRKQILKKQTVSINSIINNFLKLITQLVGEHITIKTYLEAKNDIINADSVQIEQILMNLVVNAKDALPENGEIIIKTSDIILGEEDSESHLNLKPGKYVMLAVTDNGEGMDKEVIQHIFDPFFTTKEEGKGTGLGLATIYGIVKQHDGYIYAYSEKQKGTTFKIYFPTTEKRIKIDTINTQSNFISTGNETILIVDDNPSICQLITDTLESSGYQCIVASNGNEALKLASKHKNIDLLLTDIVMPGMNGRKLAETLLDDNPNLKVLFMSGYSENIITYNGVLDTNVNFIPKPVTPIVLIKKLRNILDN